LAGEVKREVVRGGVKEVGITLAITLAITLVDGWVRFLATLV